MNISPTVNDNFSENEFGPGPFTHAAGNLKAGVVYYVRTYAQNGQGTAYGNEVSFSTKAFALGDTGIAGGTIFFDKGSYSDGWRYLEAATEDFEIINWGCLAMDIPGTMDAVGSGAANTVLITSKCKEAGIAARRCSDLVLNEYDDWFLPSKGELTLMYENLRKKGLGNLSGLVYWSSTQISIYDAIALDPSTGMQFSLNKMDARYSFARAIRAF